MDDLSKQQKPIIHAIAKNWDAISAKEIAQQTRMDSKQVSAQLSQLHKQWLIEKIPTSTKNHLYALQERFFNIWYLMRYGRRKDRNKLVWLTRFFEIWCSKDELTERARFFHQELSMAANPRCAMIYAGALINSDKLEFKEREQLYSLTRSHLEQTGHIELARELPEIDSDEYLRQGIELLKSGGLEEAETYIRKAIKVGNKRAFRILGDLLVELKRYQEAEENYRFAMEHGDTGVYNNLGNVLTELKRYDEAEANYRLAAEHGNTNAYSNLGKLFRELQRYDEAETTFHLAIDHGDTQAYHYLAILLSELLRYDEAKTNFQLAITHGDTNAYFNLAIFYSENKQYKEAEVNFRLALEHGDKDAYFSLGNVLSDLKRYKEAEANYRLTIEHGNTTAYNNLGVLFSELQRYKEAEESYRHAIEFGYTNAYNNLGKLFSELKRYEEAEDCFKQAINLGITDAENDLAWLYFETNQEDKKAAAMDFALRAVADDPCFASLHTLATVALWNDEIEIAQESIEKILLQESWQQELNNEKEFIDLLILLLAKGQTNLFDKWQQQYDLADRLKPLYYAFLTLAPEKYPDQLLRMGSELKETVTEILAKIAAYKEK